MRIIAGEFGGRHIEAPAGDSTRPMLDRVREALFGTLGERVLEARVLDLYAGSGSLGLEALSRGAAYVHFVEQQRAALETLRANIEALGVQERVRVVRADALSNGRRLESEEPFQLVFFDPPYRLLEEPRERARLLAAVDELVERWLVAPGVLVFHAPARAAETLRFPSGRKGELRSYGTSALCYLWKA